MKVLEKKISVIIPVYNAEKYISETLDSIIKQSYKNREIILVENGSKDRSSDIIQEYEEKYQEIHMIKGVASFFDGKMEYIKHKNSLWAVRKVLKRYGQEPLDFGVHLQVNESRGISGCLRNQNVCDREADHCGKGTYKFPGLVSGNNIYQISGNQTGNQRDTCSDQTKQCIQDHGFPVTSAVLIDP